MRLSLRHWAWLSVGLACWMWVAVLWMAGPYDCTPPNAHHHVVCKHR